MLRKSVISSAVIMFIIANAGLFAFLLTRAGVPDAIGMWLRPCWNRRAGSCWA
jgi:C4-dicarboxylate transporter, DctM subunit